MDRFIPPNLDWSAWAARWERMQEHYLVARAERFVTIARLVRDTQAPDARLLDLGCGTGSLLAVLLKAMPLAQGVGVDIDPTMLVLAEKQLAVFGSRARVIPADLREESWRKNIPESFDAVVSATALHWLGPEQLANVYSQIAKLLRPGGIFLNADHVASQHPTVQATWVRHRDQMRLAQADRTADDWEGFWKAYLSALGTEAATAREQALGEWRGVEDGQPLSWHFDRLLQAGFSSVDCFWRCDCDAIYGGLLH